MLPPVRCGLPHSAQQAADLAAALAAPGSAQHALMDMAAAAVNGRPAASTLTDGFAIAVSFQERMISGQHDGQHRRNVTWRTIDQVQGDSGPPSLQERLRDGVP